MTLPPDFWLWLLAFGLVVVGVAGTVLPALPGVPLVFAGMLLAAWIDDFQRIGYVTLAILAAIMAASIAIDFLAGIAGAKRYGASTKALAGAAIGTVVGLFFGLPGLALGPFLGALIGELAARRDVMAAGRVAFGTWVGMLIAIVIKLSLVFAMLGIFVFAYFVGGAGSSLA
jgi:uncharacterized protein YqgC (DUF456 family)